MANEYNSIMQLLDKFPDEATCIEHLAKLRWPDGPVCQHCGSTRRFSRIARHHLWRCGDCKRDFSVRKGTVFEESRLPLRKWFAAIWLVAVNRKGIPSTQLAREIGVSQKTAWFMLGRLREVTAAMNGLVGVISGIVEADETYFGGKAKNMHKRDRDRNIKGRGPGGKTAVVGAVSRDGHAKAQPVASVDSGSLQAFVRSNVAAGSVLMTDGNPGYNALSGEYEHHVVQHSVGEYVRGMAHTNGVESFWSLLKRAYVGVFHQMSPKHLHRYVDEFAARWNMGKMPSGSRVDLLLRNAIGVRLTWAELVA